MNNVNKNNKTAEDCRGFTLLELAVSLGIIVLISSTFVANFNYGSQKSQLNLQAQKIASSIRQAQDFALGLKEYEGAYPSGGWGARFSRQPPNNDEYVLFADIDNSGKYREDEDGTANDEVYRRVMLDKGFEISNTRIGGIGRQFAYAIFTPPDPIAHFNSANNESNDNLASQDQDEIEVTISHIASGESVIILINKYGLVDVNP